ncbi:serine/threonine-protein kinase 19 [Selaginella moellendorffii]|uniref:serine/threonine-protein kinase 19 n=1 Tax=Selaginella moellendorffii TaxID=88036 RepID=UPI000D1C49C8|nr:serine/threonine-protein kinase 19 [Selaginella moellendorffii]|eukprot:XP_024539080.1 serine/threonine-protein kinase 19 [Selaginella moellendorffii]
MVAIQLMLAQFPKLEQALKQQQVVRMFKLNSGRDDFAVMLLEDYVSQVVASLSQVSLLSRGGKTTDKQISVLINAGFLGRKEVTQLLRKRQSKEALLSVLEKRKLRSSSLGMRFHLRDLLGSSVLVSVETTSGALIRLAKR